MAKLKMTAEYIRWFEELLSRTRKTWVSDNGIFKFDHQAKIAEFTKLDWGHFNPDAQAMNVRCLRFCGYTVQDSGIVLKSPEELIENC